MCHQAFGLFQRCCPLGILFTKPRLIDKIDVQYVENLRHNHTIYCKLGVKKYGTFRERGESTREKIFSQR